MKNILTLLLILTILGILWIGSKYWSFSKEDYVNPKVVGKAAIFGDNIDLDYLKKEFAPAYEF